LLEVRNVRCSGLSRWGSKAGAHALTGKVTEGLVLIDEAVQIASRMGTFHVPNCSWSGRLAHCRQRRRRQQSFQRAFDDAGSGALRMTQLRAALRLCRLWRSQARDDANRLLRGVYDIFTEGFATPDLTEAKELLESRPSESTK
jgi:hypothetical protein